MNNEKFDVDFLDINVILEKTNARMSQLKAWGGDGITTPRHFPQAVECSTEPSTVEDVVQEFGEVYWS